MVNEAKFNALKKNLLKLIEIYNNRDELIKGSSYKSKPIDGYQCIYERCLNNKVSFWITETDKPFNISDICLYTDFIENGTSLSVTVKVVTNKYGVSGFWSTITFKVGNLEPFDNWLTDFLPSLTLGKH